MAKPTPALRHQLAPHRLIRRYGVWPATWVVTTVTFTIVSGIVMVAALLTGFPILPGLLVTLIIHLILLPQTYQTNRMIAELDATRAALYRASITDELTGAYNRRHFVECFRESYASSEAERPCSLILLDVDHFKYINDTRGHAAGDEVLRQLGALYRQHTRRDDIFARYGGEEFIFLLPDTAAPDALAFAERLRLLSAAHSFSYAGQPLAVTVSAGVATTTCPQQSASQILIAVDQALYAAKAAGRNQVVLAACPDVHAPLAKA